MEMFPTLERQQRSPILNRQNLRSSFQSARRFSRPATLHGLAACIRSSIDRARKRNEATSYRFGNFATANGRSQPICFCPYHPRVSSRKMQISPPVAVSFSEKVKGLLRLEADAITRE